MPRRPRRRMPGRRPLAVQQSRRRGLHLQELFPSRGCPPQVRRRRRAQRLARRTRPGVPRHRRVSVPKPGRHRPHLRELFASRECQPAAVSRGRAIGTAYRTQPRLTPPEALARRRLAPPYLRRRAVHPPRPYPACLHRVALPRFCITDMARAPRLDPSMTRLPSRRLSHGSRPEPSLRSAGMASLRP